MINRLRLCFVIVLLILIDISGGVFAQTQNDYFKRFDHNSDGKISLEEFQTNMRFAFDQMDANRDGVLESNEQLIPNAPRLTLEQHRTRIAQQFKKQDQNKDGFLNKVELLSPPRR